QNAVSAVAVFLVALHGFQGTQAAQFAFNRHAQLVSHFDHFAGDFHVVLKVGNGLAVGQQGAVHHHAGETQLDGAFANLGGLAVVLVHHHRDVGVGLDSSFNQVTQKRFACVFTG